MALPACTLCIAKHLEFISSRRPIRVENAKLRRRIFELAMCLGLPAIWIFIGMSNVIMNYGPVHHIPGTGYCFRSYRYIIAENFGCNSASGVSGISDVYAIVFMAPTLALSVITLVYGSMYSCIHIPSSN
jgi:pheromone a factor receptor